MANSSAEGVELNALRAIVEGTAQATGEDFFRLLVQNLSLATGVANAFVAEFADDPARVRSLAYWMNGKLIANQEWELDGTPCQEVVRGQLCHHPSGLEAKYPKEKGIESYLGVPLLDVNKAILGHLAIFSDQPMPPKPRLLFTFRIFAARAAAELGRLRAVAQLRESEERFRDLFEEAPIAYVHEGLDTRFHRANRTALRILGVSPDQVSSTFGRSLIPDTPDAQRRAREALAAVGRGIETGGVVLELRRKNDGRPIFIQWWSRPAPDGAYTRTMFIDITDRVLMEQEQARLQAQNRYLREEIKAQHNFGEMVGTGAALRKVFDKIARVAPTDASVLIRGETGTGKELVARAIHAGSGRCDRALIKINCAALPAALVESELFGHEKGAFTGATARKLGRFELADGGTIFLDEIGEMPLEVQVKLLRVLQEHELDRVGGKLPVKVDVRVIAATNRDLARAVADKSFREDLYYRLNTFPLTVPPLRERSEDIAQLAQHLIEKYSARIGRRFDGIGAASLRRLQAYRWPGNVRELENVIERAMILGDGPLLEIEAEMLPAQSEAVPESASAAGLENIERQHIVTMLERSGWAIEGAQGAAKTLGLKPSTLRSRMKKLGIRRT